MRVFAAGRTAVRCYNSASAILQGETCMTEIDGSEPGRGSRDTGGSTPAVRRGPGFWASMLVVGSAAAVVSFWASGGFEGGGAARTDAPAGVLEMPSDSPFKGFAAIPERPAPDFTLTAHDGTPFELRSTRGKATLVFFGFTHCPDVCPTTMSKLAAALAALGEDGDRVAVVFISVDPERDTPEAIQAYLEAFDPRIVGVTGTLPELEAVAASFGVRFFKEYPQGTPEDPADLAAADYSMAHSATVFLIDTVGQMRASFLEPYAPDDVAHDVRVVLAEAVP
ncbi:hypothetical protein DCC79_13870 [bacterium]|nr:MAG: hypothetical protein DCC79_13870 [bacterium]